MSRRHGPHAQRVRVGAQRHGRRQTGGDRGQQPGREVEYLPWHPVADVKLADRGARLAQVSEQVRPGGGGPRGGALREVAKHGRRPGGAAPADRPHLHRRQVLRLVHHDVRDRPGALDEVGRLVDQHLVGVAPGGRAWAAGRLGPAEGGHLRIRQQPADVSAHDLLVGEDREDQLLRVDLGPDLVHAPAYRRGPADRVVRTVVTRLAGRLELGEQHVRDPVGEQLAAGAVADAAAAQLRRELLDLVRGQPQPARAAAEHEGVGRRPQVRPQRPLEQLGHARVALDHRRLVGVRALDGDGRDQLGDGGLRDVELAEGGQHVPDVGEERQVGADDDDAAPGHQLLVRVQQVGDPVQADRGLAGARRALHAHGGGGVGADDVVLLGLDGGHDVPHRAGPRPLDLGDQQLARCAVRGVAGTGACFTVRREPLVLVGGERSPGEAEPPPPREAHRVGLAGPVEGPRHGRPPVEDDRRAVRVVHVAPPDMQCSLGGTTPRSPPGFLGGTTPRNPPASAAEVLVGPGQLGVVEPAEEQRRVRQVLERLGAAVQVGLEILQADPVACHRVAREAEDVLPHQVQVLARPREVGPLRLDDGVFTVVVLVLVSDVAAGVVVDVRGHGPGVGGHG